MDSNDKTVSNYVEPAQTVVENIMRDELLTFLAQTSSMASDEPFFNKLARYLAQCLNMDFVCIDRLEGDGLTATTVAVWCDGHFEDNVSYALKDTPCGDVVGKTVCCFPDMVCQLFPNDPVLQDLRAESYVGVTLWSHTGVPIGLIAAVSRQPLSNRPLAEYIMQIVAVRAAGEIERLNAEMALLESEKRYRQLFQNQPSGFALHEIITDPDGTPFDYRFLEINPSFERLTGLNAVDLIGKTQLEVMPNSEPYWVQRYGKVALTGESISFENYSGELNRHYQVHAYSPEPGKFATLFYDITDRKKAEEERNVFEQQLQHSQKLESLGVLSGGIAHDFNNILAIIMGYCSLIKLDYEMAEKNIPIIEKAAERAAGLCRQMMAYAGKAQLTKTKINIVEKVDDIVNMLKSTLPPNVVINANYSAGIPIIDGDASQLGQVVMNLIINASEAISTGQGKVDVSLARIKVIAVKAYEDYHGKPIPPGDYICLEVTDNGCGMDEETKWRIFEPFYTTKFTGRGLGMSAVLGIINSHNGALQLFSQPGQGTTFKVFLPAPTSDITGVEHKIDSAPPAPWHGSGTILLVEDEESIRNLVKNFLEIFGFTVLEAVNGKEALNIYQKNAADITLVLTDMGMPIMDGYELFAELKKLNPELPIIVSSGYGDAEVSSRIGSDNIAGIISKPYNPGQLRDVLKRVTEEC